VAVATRLLQSLQNAQFETWLDTDALRAGDDWNSKIEEQLLDSDYVIVLQTPVLASKVVGYVNKEIAIAKDRARYFRGTFLIPVLVDGVGDKAGIPELSTYQSITLRAANYEADFAALRQLIIRDFQRRQR
jgi:hypothetical protein